MTTNPAAVLQSRRDARRRLQCFADFSYPRYIWAEHNSQVCDALDALQRREIRKLIIEKPPRHGKTFHVCERFPAAYLGLNPTHAIISASHGDKAARRAGRRVRSLISSKVYQSLFPGTTLDPRADASDEFETQSGGRYIATGIHGNYMGSGAHLLIVDDPIRSRLEADSQIVRDKTWQAYMDLETRLEDNAIIVVQHTRWHVDDLIGRIRSQRIATGIEDWHIITQPMILNECYDWDIVEDGRGSEDQRAAYDMEQPLWPEKYDIATCRALRRTRPLRDWASLYRNQPVAEEGDYFRTADVQRFSIGEESNILNIYLTTDFGVTKGSGDATEFYVLGIDTDGHWWVLDCWHGHERPDVWISALIGMASHWHPELIIGEKGVIRRSIEPFLEREMDKQYVYVPHHWVAVSQDKHARARAFQGIVSMGRFHVPSCGWGDRLVQLMRDFGATDDDHAVDAISLVGLSLQDTDAPVEIPTKPAVTQRDIYSSSRQNTDGWKTA